MIVAYQKGLEDYAGQLEKFGFKVVPLERAKFYDAYIFHAPAQGFKSITPQVGHAFLLNVKNMPVESAVIALNSRLYTPLF